MPFVKDASGRVGRVGYASARGRGPSSSGGSRTRLLFEWHQLATGRERGTQAPPHQRARTRATAASAIAAMPTSPPPAKQMTTALPRALGTRCGLVPLPTTRSWPAAAACCGLLTRNAQSGGLLTRNAQSGHRRRASLRLAYWPLATHLTRRTTPAPQRRSGCESRSLEWLMRGALIRFPIR